MNHADIAQALLQLTGSLKPSGHTTASDLEQARTALAQTLLHGIEPAQLISGSLPASTRSAIHSAVFDDTIHARIHALTTSVVEAREPAAATTQLAYLSSLPCASTSAPL